VKALKETLQKQQAEVSESKILEDYLRAMHGYCDNRIGFASFGKNACLRHETDTPFSFIAVRTSESDVMNCPVVLEPNEFLQVAELAWTPRVSNRLDHYIFDGILRFLAPSEDDEVYNKLHEMKRNDDGFGP